MNLIHSIERFVATAAVGAIALGVVPWAAADEKTFTPSQSLDYWHVAGNWTPSGIPTASDRVIIPAGKTCLIAGDDAEVDTFVVEGDAVLKIDPGVTLTVHNVNPHTVNDPDHYLIDGEVQLKADAMLFFTSGYIHTLHGEGRIFGTHLTARVVIDGNRQLVNALAEEEGGIVGALVIQGLSGGTTNGVFNNRGIVDGTGWIELHEDTVVWDDEIAEGFAGWRATGGNLIFSCVATGLQSNFRVGPCGRLTLANTVAACGVLTLVRAGNNGWRVNVLPNMWFECRECYVDNGGDEPGTPGNGTCQQPYVINADASCVPCTF